MNPIQIRRTLHAHPELSGKEAWTSAFIVEQLQNLGIKKIHTGFAQQCIIAEIEGQEVGKTLLFRSELDALPIQEINNFEHKSQSIAYWCPYELNSRTFPQGSSSAYDRL